MGASRSWTSCCDPEWCLAQRFLFNKHKFCSTWDHYLAQTVVEKKDGNEAHFQQKGETREVGRRGVREMRRRKQSTDGKCLQAEEGGSQERDDP